jgi:tetratricopeptide (TPR) repeat protein
MIPGFRRRAPTGGAAVLLCSLVCGLVSFAGFCGFSGASQAAGARIDLDGCVDLDRDEVRRLFQLEMRVAADEPPGPTPLALVVRVSCVDGEAELRVRGAAPVVRTLDLAATPPSARARLLALAASELLLTRADATETHARSPRGGRATHSESKMFNRVLAGGLAVPVLAAAAVASTPPPTRKEAVIVAPPPALTRVAPRPPAREERAQPGLSADEVFSAVGVKVHEVTNEQINLLKRLLANVADNDPDKPELLFQLGDLHGEQQRFYRFRARQLDQKIFDARAAHRDAEAARLTAEQADDEKREGQALLESVKQYVAVAEHYPQYKRLDEVLFNLGHLLMQVHKEDAARSYYKRLIKDHPTSRFIPDAYFAFGEYYFDHKDLENALAFYEKVMEHEDSPLAGYALYKKGWCHYNLGEFKQALGIFVAVIQRSSTGGRLALEREARKDAVRAYAQIGTPERAWPFFQKIGKDAAPKMLEQLAELYDSQGKSWDAVKLYRQLMALAPDSPRLCTWQSEVLRNTLSASGARAQAETAREVERLAAVHQKLRTMRGVSKDAIVECRETTVNALRELATVWHKEAQQTNVQSTFEWAGALYKVYLSQYRDQNDRYVMLYYYGDLLYRLAGFDGQRERFCDAAPIYTEVVKLDPSPAAKYRNDAALASVLSWRKCLRVDELPPVADAAPAATTGRRVHPKPRAIPDAQLKMVDAFDTYVKYVKDSPDLVRVLWQKAYLYYEYDHLKEAIPLFREIAYKHPEDEMAVYAADLLFDCYAQLEQRSELAAANEELCALKPLVSQREDFRKRCGVIKESLWRAEAEDLERDHQYKAAGDLYAKIATEFPDDPRLDEVLYDVAINYQRAKMIGLTVLALQQLIKLKPDSPLAKKAVYMVGRDYQDIAAFEAAAENYEQFAARWPGEKEASTALYRASFFRRGLGESRKAIEDTKLFIKNYGPRSEFTDIAAGVAFGEGQIFEQQHDWKQLGDHLKTYLRDWGARGGVDREIVAHVKLGELLWREACPVEGTAGACIEIKRPRRRPQATRAPREKTCVPGVIITLHERKPPLAREAQSHFATALKLYQNGAAAKKVPGKDESERDARVHDLGFYAADARMLQGDAEYEKFLALQLPDGLAFAPGAKGRARAKDAESRKRLEAWLFQKGRRLEESRRIYQSVILLKQAHWAIAAAARIGQLFQIFAHQLEGAPIPTPPPAPAGIDAVTWRGYFRDGFCDEIGNHVAQLDDKAEDALKMCLDKSTELSWFNEWSQLCETELNALKPGPYPLATELRAEPGYFAAATDRAPVQSLESR